MNVLERTEKRFDLDQSEAAVGGPSWLNKFSGGKHKSFLEISDATDGNQNVLHLYLHNLEEKESFLYVVYMYHRTIFVCV